MAYTSSNPFELLGDNDAPVVAAVKKTPAVAAPVVAPKAAPKARTENAGRGAPRRVNQGDREVNSEGPSAGEESKEERSNNYGARGGSRGRGGARGGRGGANPRSNGGTFLGGDRPRRENGGGRVFDKHSQTAHKDTDKSEAAGWGAEDGKKELEAEALGEADAVTDAAPATDAPAKREYVPAPVEEEEEDNTQTYDEYLAAQAEKKLNMALPTARVANEGADDSQWSASTAAARKGENETEWFLGTQKLASTKAVKQKVAKVFLEIETSYKPPRRDGPREGAGAPRGGRGGSSRGRGEGRGAGRGGAPRGAPRAPRVAAVNVADTAAFPMLG